MERAHLAHGEISEPISGGDEGGRGSALLHAKEFGRQQPDYRAETDAKSADEPDHRHAYKRHLVMAVAVGRSEHLGEFLARIIGEYLGGCLTDETSSAIVSSIVAAAIAAIDPSSKGRRPSRSISAVDASTTSTLHTFIAIAIAVTASSLRPAPLRKTQE